MIPHVVNCEKKNLAFDCSDGRQSRDFLYIDDAVEAIYKCFRTKKILGKIINIGSGRLINIKNLIPSALFPEHETDLSSPALVTCLGKRLDFAISIDNGVMHMLSLSKVPMIVLFGPTDAEKFAPEHEGTTVLDSNKLYKTSNISSISVEDVLLAAKQHLNFSY